MESGQLVRMPLRVRGSSARTVGQRLLLRFPWLAVGSTRLLDRLPPSSRFRQTFLRRAAGFGIEAFNRRDFDVARLAHHPDCEYQPPREMIEAGFVRSSYRGPAGYRELMSDWSQAGDLHVEDAQLIDLGNRWVLLATLSLSWHRRADTPFSRSWASVLTLKEGRPISEQYYWDHAEAFEAAGLSE
jgi:ketosteroid isomerase-like protein